MAASNYELVRRVAMLPDTVSCSERLLLHTLIMHRNAQTGECFPTVSTLAREMNVTTRTVKSAVRRLVAFGLLTVGKRKTRDGDGNTYALNLPAEGEIISPSNDGAEGETVAPSTADRGCNPRPQRVKSATAEGEMISPEQIKEQTKNRNEPNAGARGAPSVSSRFSDSVPVPMSTADLFSASPSPAAINALISRATDVLGDEKPSNYRWRAFIKRHGARAFFDVAHNFMESVRDGKEVRNRGAYLNALLDGYEREHQDNADGGDEITPEILAALELARKAGKH